MPIHETKTDMKANRVPEGRERNGAIAGRSCLHSRSRRFRNTATELLSYNLLTIRLSEMKERSQKQLDSNTARSSWAVFITDLKEFNKENTAEIVDSAAYQ